MVGIVPHVAPVLDEPAAADEPAVLDELPAELAVLGDWPVLDWPVLEELDEQAARIATGQSHVNAAPTRLRGRGGGNGRWGHSRIGSMRGAGAWRRALALALHIAHVPRATLGTRGVLQLPFRATYTSTARWRVGR